MKKSNESSFAFANLSTFNLEGLSVSEVIALEALKIEHREEYSELNDDKVKLARHKYFNITGSKPDDYEEKKLENEQGIVQYGIRHLGGNREISFICLTPNYELQSKTEVLSIYHKIKEEFKYFSPLYLKFWTKNPDHGDFYGSVYMVQVASKINAMIPWPQEDEINFEKIIDDSYYQWYLEGYRQFHKDFPDQESKVTVNSVESMSDSLDQQLMFFINSNDGERIGFIAAERSLFLGHPGIYFQEIFIDKKFRGQGFAKAIQRKFIATNIKSDEFVWGTVDSLNVPSFKTAAANNRLPVRYECFLRL